MERTDKGFLARYFDSRSDKGFFARYFNFQAEGTSYRAEIIGGVTTFLAISYIIFVNPEVLGDAGMEKGAVYTATVLSMIIGCLLMAFVARYPMAIAPSMGLNAYFSYSVVIGMGISWETALTGTLFSGIIFVFITLFKIRELILNIIPQSLKVANACGLGLFIAFIGLQGSGIIVDNEATLVTLGNLTVPTTALTIFGLILTFFFMVRRIPGAIFLGMAATSILGILTGVIQPPSSIISHVPSIAPIFGVAFTNIFTSPAEVFTPHLAIVVITFLIVEFFDTAAALIAVATYAGFINDKGEIRHANRALFSDASSILAGATVGVSPTSVLIESTTGIESGARTGFSTLIVAILCCFALFFSPLLQVVTPNVTAPALIVLGILMLSEARHIDWSRLENSIPAFFTMIMMPLTYNIAVGTALGLMLYPTIMFFQGRAREVHALLYVLFVIFLLYFVFLV